MLPSLRFNLHRCIIMEVVTFNTPKLFDYENTGFPAFLRKRLYHKIVGMYLTTVVTQVVTFSFKLFVIVIFMDITLSRSQLSRLNFKTNSLDFLDSFGFMMILYWRPYRVIPLNRKNFFVKV